MARGSARLGAPGPPASLPALAAVLLLTPAPARAQEPEPEPPPPGADTLQADTAAVRRAPGRQPQGRRCTLTWEPAGPDTRLRSLPAGENFRVHHVGGGMVWTCGSAVMEADSAVRYERDRRVEMMGDVRYRDSIRTLRSRRLVYYEVPDRIVATGEVRLTRLRSGSTLEGPHVEFMRALSGQNELTRAFGRPHMVLRSETDPDAPPYEVDADRTVFAGEEEARAWGDVRIRREEVRARADSALFDLEAGGGVLYGSPWATGPGFRLAGDTLRLDMEENVLRRVMARGAGRATGEGYDVLAREIDARVEGERVEEVWARGEGRALAVAEGVRLHGDALRFVFLEGRIDSVVARGSAAAVTSEGSSDAGPDGGGETPGAEGAEGQDDPDPPLPVGVTREEDRWSLPEPRLAGDEDASWVAGDTLYVLFEPRPAGPEVEDAEPEAAEAEAQLRRLHAIGSARSYYTVRREGSAARRPSRSYLVGREIEVHFEDGEARHVEGVDAIGLYMDPVATGGEQVRPDTAPPPSDSLPPDSLAIPPAGLPAPDSVPVPPDSLSAFGSPGPRTAGPRLIGWRAGPDWERLPHRPPVPMPRHARPEER